MKCPTCLSTMKCISKIHNVPNQPGRQRMDLHCFNRKNNDGRTPNICRSRCHMGVITEDPKEWVCHEYTFDFQNGNKTYILRSYDYLVDPYHQRRLYESKTILSSDFSVKPMVILPCFIPLSTSDDMHEKAWELFNRLKKLIVFS